MVLVGIVVEVIIGFFVLMCVISVMFFGSVMFFVCSDWLVLIFDRLILRNFGRVVGRYLILIFVVMCEMIVFDSFMVGLILVFRKCSGIFVCSFFFVLMCWKFMCSISCLNGWYCMLCSRICCDWLVILRLRIDEWKVFFFRVCYRVLWLSLIFCGVVLLL